MMSNKRESTFTSMVVTLFLVTLAASSALGFIYQLTKGPINQAKTLKKNTAISEVVPAYDNDPLSSIEKMTTGEDTLYFYIARKNGEISGIAVESFTDQGFSGRIRIMVGFTPDGFIYDIIVLEHQETPGLGDKIEKKKSLNKATGRSWSSQFSGKHPEQFTLSVKKDGGNVDAITASTITSRAFCDAVQRAYEGFLQIRERVIPADNALMN